MIKSKLTKRKCKYCDEKFQQIQPLQYLCLPPKDCSWKYQERLRANKLKKENKEERAELKVLKEGLLTHKDYIKMFQVVFNTFIRVQDKDLPCISCGTTKNVEYAAGHYIPTTYQYLRFNEFNVNKQCNKHCNMMLRGNITEYRINLIKKIGVEEVEHLENSRHMMLEITIPELKNLIIEYKNKIKELQKK